MKVSQEKLANSRVALQIEVDQELVAQEVDKAYRKLVRQTNIPGFRKGKAPRSIFERYVGTEVLYNEALYPLLMHTYEQAVRQEGIIPVDDPHFEIEDYGEGKGLKYKAEVDVYPEVQLGEYKGLSVEKPVLIVDEPLVQRGLERLQEQYAELASVERKEVQEKDFVLLDFTGYIDGEPFPGGAAEGYMLEVGSGSFIPGFEEQLVGMEVGQEGEVQVTFPENYHNEELAGQGATFKVTIQEIKEKRLPELDDEFAKNVGEGETLEELKTKIRENLENRAKEQSDMVVRESLIKQVVDNAHVEIPRAMIERETEMMLNQFRNDLARHGMDFEGYLAMLDKTEEAVKEDFRPAAENRVKTDLVLERIGLDEGIEVTEEEIEQVINDALAGNPDDEQLRQDLEGRRQAIIEVLRRPKVVDFLVEQAQVTVVEKTDEEFREAPDEGTPGDTEE
ncbi:MAG: trigger factor [Limnochordia bacterium]|jgi:trigger factor